MAKSVVHCSAMGQAEIGADGIRLTPEAGRQFGLALYFCAHAGQDIPRDDVAALFWPDQDMEAARHCLRQALYRLRAVGVPVRSGAKATVLDARLVDADFMPVIAEGAPPSAFLALSGVAVLPGYAPTFSPSFARWVEEFRTDVGGRLRRGLVRALADVRARGRYADVDRLARQILLLDPLNEEATLALAEAVALAGGKAEAMRMIERYEEEIGERRDLCVSPRILRSRVSDLMVEWGTTTPRVPLIGREQELEVLMTSMRQANRDGPCTIRFGGEGGVGKTSVVEEFLRIAQLQSGAAIRVLCHSSERERPFSALCDIVTQLLAMPGALGADPQSLADLQPLVSYRAKTTDEEDTASPQTSDRRRLLTAASDLIDAVSEESPLVVVVDDAHFIDDDSLGVLGAISAPRPARRVLLVVCHRPQSAWTPDRLALLDSSKSTCRELRPLSQVASRELIEALIASVDLSVTEDRLADLLQLAGGNPLFMVELIGRLREYPYESVPANLDALLQTRIQSRTTLARMVLQGCVILGKHASIDRLERVLELAAFELTAALNELESYGLLTAEHTHIQCRHELIANVVERDLVQSASTFLRKRAAAVLEEDALATGDPSLLWQSAQYLETTHQLPDARRTLEQLSDYLLGIGSAKEAGEALERVISYCEGDDDRARLLGKLLVADRIAGNWPRILETISTREQLAEAQDHPDLERDSDVLLYFEALFRTDNEPASLLNQILNELRQTKLRLDARFALALMGLILADNVLKPDAAIDVFKTISLLGETTAHSSREGLTAYMIYHCTFGELDEAVHYARMIQETAPSLVSANIHELQRHRWTSTPFLYSGRFDEAKEVLMRVYHTAHRRRLRMEAFEACEQLVMVSLREEDLDAAHQWQRTAAHWRDSGDALSEAVFAADAAMIALWERRFEEAEGLLHRASQSIVVRPNSRSRLRLMGIELAVAIGRLNIERAASLSPELLILVHRAWNFGDNDLPICALARSLALRDENEQRDELLSEYALKRRERYAIPASLAEMLGSDATRFPK